MDFRIRESQASDVPQMMALIRELADFEKELHEVALTEDQLRKDGYGPQPMFHCFVAEEGDTLIGLALCYPRYSTWKGATLHLEDLIVTETRRGFGIGTALLDQVVRYAAEIGVKRVKWEVLDWNQPAIDFYEQKGARVYRDWDVVILEESAINTYLETL